MALLVLRESAIRTAVGMEEAVDAIEDAFSVLSRGEANLPDVLSLTFPEEHGDLHVKGAHLKGAPHFAIKIASGFYDNPARGSPRQAD